MLLFVYNIKEVNILENENLVEDNTDIYRDLEDVVSALKMAKEENINVNLLIGAGCSVTANIPAAQGMIDTIKEKYPREFKRAKIKDYPNCMSKLTPSERKNLISQTIKDAKINWTHIAIAQLLKHGYINRILTPNFDNLVQRACALVGEFPGIYDLTTSSEFKKDLLFDKSVIHLHGQHTGFILCNTETEVEEQFQTLKPVFQQLDEKSLWIVIGYSGNNDPIFKLLSKKNVFEHRLFWIGYEDNEPSKMLSDELLSEEKYAFFIKGFNSDDFFVKLSQQLDCFPPAFIHKPFTYLSQTLDTLANYRIPTPYSAIASNDKKGNSTDLHIITKNVVKKAIDSIEEDKALMAQNYFMAGLFDETIKLAEETTDTIDFELEYLVINAYRQKGQIPIAMDRLSSLEKQFPENHIIKKDLANFYFITGIANGLKTNDLKDLQLSMALYKKACNLSTSLDSLFQWDLRLNIIHEILFEESHEETHQFLRESINTYLDCLNSIEIDDEDTYILSSICDIILQYIECQQFDYAKTLLEKLLENKFFATETQANIMASWGLWHFKNKNISVDIALTNGLNYYEKGIELLNNDSKINQEDIAYIQYKQRFLLEHAKFLSERTYDSPIPILRQCIELAVDSELSKSILKEATQMLELIEQSKNVSSLVASTTSLN
ncbi:hypothetical protein CN357_31640 [Bacillus cereus]|uniref:SIR2-like domain-containing protein n=1 Tax=Bacillus cereus TaxID=1396 RepID=A0A9X6VS97_BACCE|nr:hypothetical protein CN357_31640 [Bacillus cereus]PFO41244.1 hypothetical protein COJ82_04580 [Bacillus cereus]PGT26776.1 hypothetical protein COC99_11635 [Bacillus cereus]